MAELAREDAAARSALARLCQVAETANSISRAFSGAVGSPSVPAQLCGQLPAQHPRPTVVPDTPESQWGMGLASIMLRNQGVFGPGAPASPQSVGSGAAARPQRPRRQGLRGSSGVGTAWGRRAPARHRRCRCLHPLRLCRARGPVAHHSRLIWRG